MLDFKTMYKTQCSHKRQQFNIKYKILFIVATKAIKCVDINQRKHRMFTETNLKL